MYATTVDSFFRSPIVKDQIAPSYSNTAHLTGLGVPVISSRNPLHWFDQTDWTFGIATSARTDNQVKLSLNTDLTANIVSIMPKNVTGRKIIRSIDIKCDKNVNDNSLDFVKYSILQIKKTLYDDADYKSKKTNCLFNKTHRDKYITTDQLVELGCFFSENIDLDDLNYDLSSEDDLILIQKINVPSPHMYYSGVSDTRHRGIVGGLSLKMYAHYSIVVEYSLGNI